MPQDKRVSCLFVETWMDIVLYYYLLYSSHVILVRRDRVQLDDDK